MTDDEYRRLVFNLHYTLYRLGLYEPSHFIPSHGTCNLFVKKYRRYTELTDGM